MEKTTSGSLKDCAGEAPAKIETTLGDLISAISEAAREATVEEENLSEVTQMILQDLLNRRKD